MTTIDITVTFEHRVSGDFYRHDLTLDVDDSLENTIQDEIDEWLEENKHYEYVGSEVISWCRDYKAPNNFDNLDEYGAYVLKCEEHGEAYVLRYEDVGDHDFEDEYNGCWGSEEDFIQDLIDGCYNVPDWVAGYIDWEKMTRDYMMDYSSYLGDDGYHIFRN